MVECTLSILLNDEAEFILGGNTRSGLACNEKLATPFNPNPERAPRRSSNILPNTSVSLVRCVGALIQIARNYGGLARQLCALQQCSLYTQNVYKSVSIP